MNFLVKTICSKNKWWFKNNHNFKMIIIKKNILQKNKKMIRLKNN